MKSTGRSGKSTLETYAFPVIGSLSVAAIDTSLILKIIEPMWRTKPETGSRVRGRIEIRTELGDSAGFPTGREPRAVERPSRIACYLHVARVHTVKHHAALPYEELPVFMDESSIYKAAVALVRSS